MPRDSLQRVVDRRLAEVDPRSERWCDLQLDLLAEDDDGRRTDQLITRAGGRWDRRLKDYVGDADVSVRVSAHPGQLEFASWFDEWLADHIAEKKMEVFSALVAGGRRGGKSDIAIKAAVEYALAVDGSIVWIVCPTDKHFEEVLKVLDETCLHRSWYEYLGAPWFRYMLVNGSRIVLRSAHNPKMLKKGRCDFAVMNEAQSMKEEAFANVRAAVADRGGLCLAVANPPDEGDPGLWVSDFAVEAQEGMREHARFFFVNPEDNPHIDQRALRALAQELDPRTYDIQILGRFLGPKDAVFYNWDRAAQERKVPDVADDITADFTLTYDGIACDTIWGLDVQSYPYMAAVGFKVFRNPRFPDSMARALLWAVDEIALEAGDEEAVATELLERGHNPFRTLIVLDASGWWQTAATAGRKKSDPKVDIKPDGRGSFHLLRAAGFPHVVRPDRKMKKNPIGTERARAVCARISTKSGERYLYVDPRCKVTAKAMRLWKNKNGQPSRGQIWAHHGDGVGYVVWRYFPRRQKGGSVSISVVTRKPGTNLDAY